MSVRAAGAVADAENLAANFIGRFHQPAQLPHSHRRAKSEFFPSEATRIHKVLTPVFIVEGIHANVFATRWCMYETIATEIDAHVR